jgi:LPS export ABC transporter protein LptC
MTHMKARLRFVIVLAAIGLVAGIGILVGRTLWQHAESELAQHGLDFLPEVAQRIQDFHRVHVRDGQKVWEIAASEARYFDEEQRIVVRDPMLRLFLHDGRSVGVKGNEGTVSLDGKELRSVELVGAIEVTLPDYVVRTEYAEYDRAADLISAPGVVQISGNDLDVQGGAMEVEVGVQRLHLSKDVIMTLRPKGGAHDGA